ncbi:MAG: ATP-dependent 6-phosphofructokinase [Planctomycetota bacterium]
MTSPGTIRRIGVLTGGGDCPGLNAVIRAVSKTAMYDYGVEVVGIEDGYQGLIENRMRHLTRDDVSGILTVGGTILGTSNKASPAFYHAGTDDEGRPVIENRVDQCLHHVEQNALDAIVAIGGDGTMAASMPLIEAGVNVIGVPKTIDNDIEGTDLTFGFLTAVDIATDALDRVHTTAASHHRVIVVEVMGRNAGWIALHAGVASGSDVLLLPEIPFSMDAVCDFVTDRAQHGRRYSIVCASEGAKPVGGKQFIEKRDPTSPDPIRLGGIAEAVSREIEQRTKIETRHVVLGHVQRGGSPNSADRVLSTQFGHHAMEVLAGGHRNRLVVMRRQHCTDIPIEEIAGKQRLIPRDHQVLAAARAVGTCLGE